MAESCLAGGLEKTNASLSGLVDKTDKNDPNQEDAGDHPNKKISMPINLIFCLGNHVHVPLTRTKGIQKETGRLRMPTLYRKG